MIDISTRIAINKTAKIVTSKSTEPEYEQTNEMHKRLLSDPCGQKPPKISEIGQKRGKVTIVNFYGKKRDANGHPKGESYFIGKCVCGYFVYRKAAKWRKMFKLNIPDEGCTQCEKNNHRRSLSNKSMIMIGSNQKEKDT